MASSVRHELLAAHLLRIGALILALAAPVLRPATAAAAPPVEVEEEALPAASAAAGGAASACAEAPGNDGGEALMEVTLMQRGTVLESARPAAEKRAVVDGRGGRISLYGVETRDNRSSIPCDGVPGWSFRNLGAHRPWEGWRGRTELYLEQIKAVSEEDPEHLVILSDVSDMIFGGCSETELLNYYYDVVAHSKGAAVVYGAEIKLHPYNEWQILGYQELEHRRHAVQAAAGIKGNDYCPDAEQRRDWKGSGYGFSNAGFVMGPAKKVYKVLEGILTLPAALCSDDQGSWDDQMAASSYMLRHPSEVTLDYSGRVVLTHSSPMYACQGKRFVIAVQGKHIFNNVTKTTACFVHGNANANHKPEWIMMKEALQQANA